MKTLWLAIVLGMVGWMAQPLPAAQDDPSGLNLIPWPKSVKLAGGTLELTAASRIVAADAKLDPLAKAWWAAPAPQWLQVDLQQVYQVGRVTVTPHWDGTRYYQYTVEVSTDGKTWTQVVDMSKNTTPGTNKGFTTEFKATPARYVKINMLKNSANVGVHLVEFHVYAAQQSLTMQNSAGRSGQLCPGVPLVECDTGPGARQFASPRATICNRSRNVPH